MFYLITEIDDNWEFLLNLSEEPWLLVEDIDVGFLEINWLRAIDHYIYIDYLWLVVIDKFLKDSWLPITVIILLIKLMSFLLTVNGFLSLKGTNTEFTSC